MKSLVIFSLQFFAAAFYHTMVVVQLILRAKFMFTKFHDNPCTKCQYVTQNPKCDGAKGKVRGSPESLGIYSLGTIDICTKSWQAIQKLLKYFGLKEVDQLTNNPRTKPLAWLKKSIKTINY